MALVEGREKLEAILRELDEKAVPAAIRRASKIVATQAIERVTARVAEQQLLPREKVRKRMRLLTPRGGSTAYTQITVYRSAMPVINRGNPHLILGSRGPRRKGWKGSILTAGGRSYPGSFLVYIPQYQHWQIMHRTAVAIAARQRFQIDATREEMSAVLTQAYEQEKDTILNALESELGKQLTVQLKREMKR